MRTVSQFNAIRDFHYELRESRLKKAAAMIEALPPGDMLDVGCSTGEWGEMWLRRGWTVAGLDIDPEHARVASSRGIDARVVDLNTDSFPFADESFDLVFAGEVIEHLVDTDGFMSELRRCTRPGGHVLLTTPNLASFENRLRLLLGRYPVWLDYNLAGSGHVRAYTPRVLRRQLETHGFEVAKHLGNWVPFLPQKFTDDIKVPALSITGTLFPALAMDIIMLARKPKAG